MNYTNSIKVLTQDQHHNISPEVEVASGRFELLTTFRKALNQIRRIRKWKRGT